jgi:hypothetical protein
LDNCHVRITFATNGERTAKRISDDLGTATELRAQRTYAGHRLALTRLACVVRPVTRGAAVVRPFHREKSPMVFPGGMEVFKNVYVCASAAT